MRTKNVPVSHQAYVSAVTPNSTTISGPSHTLKNLFDSATFRATGYSALSIPVFAPYHASHLHQAADIDWIIGADDPATSQILGRYKRISVLLSTSTGKPFIPTDMTSLLRKVVNEILNDVLRWDTLIAEVDTLVSSQCEVTATMIGSPGLGKSLISALSANGKCEASLKSAAERPGKDISGDHEHQRGQRSKIAIVGMSGRFPGAKDTEELWSVLSQGLDVHKEVCNHEVLVRTRGMPANSHRFPKIALMSTHISTLVGRERIPVSHRMVASSISQVSSILHSFKYLLEKPQLRILCSALRWYPHVTH